jgi:predicted SprT family Zn-dependent metalloprotease
MFIIYYVFFGSKSIRKHDEKQARLERQYNVQVHEYQNALPFWEHRMRRWNNTYYCHCDDVVYIPSERAVVEPARMRQIL